MITTFMRRLITLAFTALVIALVGLAGVVNFGPQLGYEPVIIRGASMEPTIPLGSLAIVKPTAPDGFSIGSIVTIRRDNGVLVTHRLIDIVDNESASLQLKGDNNEHPDAKPVSPSTVVGTVDQYVPLAGYITYLLGQPSGIMSLLSLLGTLFLASRLFEDGWDDEDVAPEAADNVQPAPRRTASVPMRPLALALLVTIAVGADTDRAVASSTALFNDVASSAAAFSTALTWPGLDDEH